LFQLRRLLISVLCTISIYIHEYGFAILRVQCFRGGTYILILDWNHIIICARLLHTFAIYQYYSH
jgi:hypothetical protein